MTAGKLTATELAALDRARFVEWFGGVFEHSPWVAETAFAAGPFASRGALHAALARAMRTASRARQLDLIRAHPDLAGRAAMRGDLTAASTAEQAGAGLSQCTPEEYARFQTLNRAYREKFGFPFVIAVKGHTRAEILAAFGRRLDNSPEAEFDEALDQIARIARLRLDDLISD
jgi:2-oxo-4-hydroxy-4-carboxy-5-ureidoimidazoline decarboxylase